MRVSPVTPAAGVLVTLLLERLGLAGQTDVVEGVRTARIAHAVREVHIGDLAGRDPQRTEVEGGLAPTVRRNRSADQGAHRNRGPERPVVEDLDVEGLGPTRAAVNPELQLRRGGDRQCRAEVQDDRRPRGGGYQ